MSTDSQPRKRKDKRRKKGSLKEDVVGLEQEARAHTPPAGPKSSNSQNEDCNIHVHHDASTGGGWCAKIVFFCLLAGLFCLIGVILLEYRGSSDLDTPVTESKYAQFFDGWIDDAPQLHDDEEDDHNIIESTEHEEGEDGHSQEEEDTEEHAASEEEEEGAEENEEEQLAYQQRSEEDETDNEEVASEQDEDNDNVSKGQDEEELADGTTEDHVENTSEPYEEEDTDEIDASQPEESNEIINEGEAEEEEEELNMSPEELQQLLDDMDDDEPLEEVTESTEAAGEQGSDSGEDVIENNAGEAKIIAEQEAEEEEEEPSGVAVKFGVGVALVVVAHLVLVRKWSNASSVNTATPPVTPSVPVTEDVPLDSFRRNTMVPNAENIVDLEREMERARENEYDISAEEDGADEEEEEEEMDEEEIEPTAQHFASSRYTYNRTPEPEIERKLTSNIETAFRRISPPANTVQYDDEDEEEVEEEEEAEQEEEADEEEDDDEELLKKLEAKYGKLSSKQIEASDDESKKQIESDEEQEDSEIFPSWRRVKALPDNGAEETDSDREPPIKQTGQQSVNDDDVIDDNFVPDSSAFNNNIEALADKYKQLVQQYPKSAKILFRYAQILDALAEKRRSNQLLTQAIQAYLDVLSLNGKDSDEVYVKAAMRYIDRIRFKGDYSKAVVVHEKLIDKFPEVALYRNQLAVTYLLMDSIKASKNILLNTLTKWPNDGFALSHYGFILKTAENNLSVGAKYLQKGIESREEGTIDGRFYFHLGDAYMRLGKKDAAMQVYCNGVKEGLFLSKYQRSLYNVNRLTARPWWTKQQTTYARFLDSFEIHWEVIRNEGMRLLNAHGQFKDEAENLRDTGDWRQFELFARGRKFTKNCEKTPFTCALIDKFPAASQCRRGQVKFSVMQPGTHVWPHCGPTNCRLRAHLGLVTPPKTAIRVADETRSWEKGKIIIFDDSFEHEVWHNGTGTRLVLIVDMWHPELTSQEKQTLPMI